jgi:hypothetical protein
MVAVPPKEWVTPPCVYVAVLLTVTDPPQGTTNPVALNTLSGPGPVWMLREDPVPDQRRWGLRR